MKDQVQFAMSRRLRVPGDRSGGDLALQAVLQALLCPARLTRCGRGEVPAHRGHTDGFQLGFEGWR